MIRVGHFSDLHYSTENLEEADRCFGFAIDEAIRRGIDVAVLSGDATDHWLAMHNPAVEQLERQIARLADHCPVLMLQGTFSHEPPGTLATFGLLRARHPIQIVEQICQVALLANGSWLASDDWRFREVPSGARALFTCVPTVNKALVAAVVGAADAAYAQGEELAALLAGYAAINQQAREAKLPTIGVSHGTVSGCVTEHGVPMAGFDHEFTVAGLFAAMAQAFLLGHIHRSQTWEEDGRLIGYAGSIGRYHYGEIGEKGFLLWDVGAALARCELIATPARRTLDLNFVGAPDLQAIETAVAAQGIDGAHVRVRWSIAEEDRHQIDREAIKRALAGAADVQLDGRILPVVRSRAPGISRASGLSDQVRAWCRLTNTEPDALLGCLTDLSHRAPADIVADVLSGAALEAPEQAEAHPQVEAITAGTPADESPPCVNRELFAYPSLPDRRPGLNVGLGRINRAGRSAQCNRTLERIRGKHPRPNRVGEGAAVRLSGDAPCASNKHLSITIGDLDGRNAHVVVHERLDRALQRGPVARNDTVAAGLGQRGRKDAASVNQVRADLFKAGQVVAYHEHDGHGQGRQCGNRDQQSGDAPASTQHGYLALLGGRTPSARTDSEGTTFSDRATCSLMVTCQKLG